MLCVAIPRSTWVVPFLWGELLGGGGGRPRFFLYFGGLFAFFTFFGPPPTNPMMFFSAVASGNVQGLKRMLGTSPKSAAVFMHDGKSLLHKVAESRLPVMVCREMVTLLLAHGAPIESRLVATKHTPLMTAILARHLDAVSVLIEKGANPNALIGTEPMGFVLIDMLRDEPYMDIVVSVTRMNVNLRNSKGESMLEVSFRRNRFQRVFLEETNVDGVFSKSLMETAVTTKQDAEIVQAVLMQSKNPRKLYLSQFVSGCCMRSYAELSDELYGLCLEWERMFVYWTFMVPSTIVWKRALGPCYAALLPEDLVKLLVDYLFPLP